MHTYICMLSVYMYVCTHLPSEYKITNVIACILIDVHVRFAKFISHKKSAVLYMHTYVHACVCAVCVNSNAIMHQKLKCEL